MSLQRLATLFIACVLFAALPALGANYPAPKQGDWVARDFRFHTGEVLPEVKLHYRTIGEPTGEPVLVLHGTAGSGAGMLTKNFAEELFGPGQPLDASRYYIILPDALGTGQSTRPSSSGMRMKFPKYNYDDMVQAQYRLVTEGLGVKHLRLVIGNSMGGMQTWLWAVNYPDVMDAVVPMACLPAAMSGRNWIMRRLLAQSIRNDPEWDNGNYTTQPRNMQRLLTYFSFATSNGNQSLFKQAPTSAKGDALLTQRLAAPFRGDANDVLYQWESSADFDPSPGLDRIKAAVLAINAADDERNPTELGIMDQAMKRLKNGRYLLIPASPDTRGHGTTGMAKFYKKELAELLEQAPRR
ncbi:MAG: alpha/beta fold hydrolase [Betaproteobacteria bacterium]|nr:alpha/beta fold hydrolase [Betaproteobacteria bacterium]MBI3053855.1 alpha/beta fold hydrolase [Betaproteobacteria bacterium]